MRGYFRKTIINDDKTLQSYIIGLAIGDGNLSNPNGRAACLRITCDKKYPLLTQKIFNSLKKLLPENKVNIVDRGDQGCVDVKISSNHLENLLGWKAKSGSKFLQKVSVPNWIKKDDKYKIDCLRGLVETDGSIYFDRGYKMIIFTTIIPKLAKDFYKMVNSLGFKSHFYKINQKPNKKYKFNQQTTYHIRLSKDVDKFLDLVKPEKK